LTEGRLQGEYGSAHSPCAGGFDWRREFLWQSLQFATATAFKVPPRGTRRRRLGWLRAAELRLRVIEFELWSNFFNNVVWQSSHLLNARDGVDVQACRRQSSCLEAAAAGTSACGTLRTSLPVQTGQWIARFGWLNSLRLPIDNVWQLSQLLPS